MTTQIGGLTIHPAAEQILAGGRRRVIRLVTRGDGGEWACSTLAHAYAFARMVDGGADPTTAYWRASPTGPYGHR